MTDAGLTFVILGVTIALFVTDRLRLDVVALMSLLALVLLGLVTTEEALAGFSNPVVVMIAGLFVVGGALSSTGVADWLGQRLGRLAGQGEARLVVVVMLAAASLSAFMSSTGTVAVLLPVVGTLAQRRRIAPARVLMPLALGSLLGGMLTLIGTPPNLVVSGALRDAGHAGFSFFSFLGPGAVMLALGIGFMLIFGRRVLPRGDDSAPQSMRSLAVSDLAREYGLELQLHSLRLRHAAPLVGKTLAEANLRAEFGVTIVSIAAGGQGGPARRVVPQARFEVGDMLLVQGSQAEVTAAAERWGLEQLGDPSCLELPGEESLAEVVLPRRSALVGRTLGEVRFRDRHRATVLGVRRASEPERVTEAARMKSYRLEAGDTLLLKSRVAHLRQLREERRDFVLLTEPDPNAQGLIDGPRGLGAVGITLGMLVVMTFGWLPNVVAVLCAAALLVLTGCIRAAEAYRGINWESVVLIAGMLPLATALDKSGGMRLVVDGLTEALGGASPRVVLVALFVLTSLFSQVISNTATTVLVAPVAVGLSAALGVAPHPLLMAVAVAASTAFSTPIASPVNTLVMGPGGYRFKDFVRVGVPLQLLVLTATVLVVPLFFPF